MLTGSLLVRSSIGLIIAALLRTLTITALALLIATLRALAIVITGLIATFALRTLTITALGTLTVTTLALLAITTLRTLTIVITGLIATFALRALTIAALTLLVTATVVIVTGTEAAATLGSTSLKTCSETLGTETAFIIIVVMETGTLEIRALSCMYTRTR
jgi:hypothetical protein